MIELLRRLRLVIAASVLVAGTACSRPGLNAGEQGGRAFIAFTVMLLAMVAVLAIFLGRED